MRGGLRIDSLRIHGFGHFSGYELKLGPGLHLLHGPNEAGKSTLLAFLRGMLFGFDKRGRGESRYVPEGGTFGGELGVSVGGAPLVVRRMANSKGKVVTTVLGPDGLALPASRLDEALSHVSRELFHEVFAFSLEELSSFEKLAEEDGVSRALFAAGLRGARRLPEVERQMEKRAEGLFKKSGTRPELNQALKALEEVRQRLEALKDRPERYHAERERLESLGRQQEAATAQRDTLARELTRVSRLEAALGDLGELARVRGELATLPDLSSFPVQGVARLEELLQRRTESRGALARVEESLASVRREWHRVSAPTGLREREESLRAALGAFTAKAELVRALPGRRATLEARRREVEQSLGGLGLEVGPEALLSLELGAAARGALEVLADELTGAEAARRESEAALGRARAERERLEAALTRLEVECARLPDVSVAELRQRQAALGRWRLLRVEREQVTAQRAELQQRLQNLRAQAEPEPGPAPSGLPVALSVAGAVLGVVVLGVGWGLAAGAMALVGGLLILAPLVLSHRRSRLEHARGEEAHAARQRHHTQEQLRLQSALDGLAGRRVGLERELRGAAEEAGVSAEAALASFAGTEAALAEALRQAERGEHLGREREGREAERDGAVREAQAAELAGRRAEVRLQHLRAELVALQIGRAHV